MRGLHVIVGMLMGSVVLIAPAFAQRPDHGRGQKPTSVSEKAAPQATQDSVAAPGICLFSVDGNIETPVHEDDVAATPSRELSGRRGDDTADRRQRNAQTSTPSDRTCGATAPATTPPLG